MSSQRYHDLSSYQRNNMPMHFLDWENQPSVFKTYPEAELIQLDRHVRHHEEKLTSLLKSPGATAHFRNPDVNDISRIFSLAYSLTGKTAHGDGHHYYRSVASAGALYPAEMYVNTTGIQGLDDGLYHFSVAHHGLTPLRRGDFSKPLSDALRSTIDAPPLITFILSAIFFRSAWKYQKRAYRYHLLDTGHLLENLIVALKAQAYPFLTSLDFDDHALNRFLGVNETKEVCLAVCYVPGEHPFKEEHLETKVSELPESVTKASIVSRKETEYYAISEIHAESSLKPQKAITHFPEIDPVGLISEETIDIRRPDTRPDELDYQETFLRRRSRRNYVSEPIKFDYLATLLGCLSIKDPMAGSTKDNYGRCVRTGLIAGNAEGLDPGFYLLDDSRGSLGMIDSGRHRRIMARICLDQKWLANAAVHFVFLTDIEMLDRYYGARGYRFAMIVAGRMGERLYLAATAMGLGCCGIGAFYDTEAAQLLRLRPASRLLYLVAVGPVKAL